MSLFKEMDPDLVFKAIDGYIDVLSPEADSLERLYSSRSCPWCQQGLQKEFDAKHVFSDQSKSIGRALLRCANCQYLLDPHSNLIVEYGDASKIPVESSPIIRPK